MIGGNCPIGSTGPGGGTVFYDAGSQQSWGRYLEVAPSEWAGRRSGTAPNETNHDPLIDWCAGRFQDQATAHSGWTREQLANLGVEIGKGRSNTEMLLTYCPYNRDNQKIIGFVSQYNEFNGLKNGIGKKDWYLPSKDELNELCKYVNYQQTGNSQVQCKQSGILRTGFVGGSYWSSSQNDAATAWWQSMSNGVQGSANKDFKLSIRIIREF